MKYNLKLYNRSVSDYKKTLGDIKGKLIFIIFDIKDEAAFFSMAPLSEAVHDLGGELSVMVKNGKSEAVQSLTNAWSLYARLKTGERSKETEALREFIGFVEKKAKGRFEPIWRPAEILLLGQKQGFVGTMSIPYKPEWFRPYRWKELQRTSDRILKQVYNIRRGERFNIGFELMLANKDLDKPKEDYLDSYAICWAMLQAAKRYTTPTMGAASPRMSMLFPMERSSDLRTTLLGCELSKKIDEPALKLYRKLSPILRTDKLKIAHASFFISGKGYPGKHVFGEVLGYPSPNRKTRWSSPGGFIYKLDYAPQTKLDSRLPRARFAFTDTLPLDIYIDTCNIDWLAMAERNRKLREIAEKSQVIRVESNIKGKHTTNLEVGLVKPNGQHRWARGSDVSTRHKINKEYFKRTGIKAGNMANIPGGEMFTTPEYIEGTFVGDVVISIDQSYRLDAKNPLVVKCSRKGYKIISGPKDIISKFEKKKKDAWENILKQEKFRSIPQQIIDMKKKNFSGIGEFAINTNPKARLCDYLIVNEKIANMMHIALGSGFEPDKATDYHTDIVFDAPRQKLDVYGLDRKGNRLWILKNGRSVA